MGDRRVRVDATACFSNSVNNNIVINIATTATGHFSYDTIRNCLTLNDMSFPSHYLPSRTVVLTIVFTAYATLKMSMIMTTMIIIYVLSKTNC